jgi:hypothetical protein
VKTRDGAQRLPELLAQVQSFADEIIVSVDDGSVDDSLEIARANADLVLRFRHSGYFDPVEHLSLARTRCDWILRLDDDHRLDAAFPGVLDELLADDRYTHWHMPRLALTSFEPPLAIYRPPWHPQWITRLVRADPTLVWRPRQPHDAICVMGLGGWESRTAILHCEAVLFDDAGIQEKIDRYTRLDDRDNWRFDRAAWRDLGEPLRCPLLEPRSGPRRRGEVDRTVVDVDDMPRQPQWGAQIAIAATGRARVGEEIVARASLANTGSMTWWPTCTPDTQWPQLGLHVRAHAGADRSHDHAEALGGYPIPHVVAPGDCAELLCLVRVPSVRGEYTLEWDMASHGRCWFSELGSAVARSHLVVE